MYNEFVIVARAPLRISLAGGGSDIPSFFQREFGEVLSFSINKYVYLAGHEYFAGGIRLSYSKTETVQDVEKIEHPLFRNALLYLDFQQDIELSSFADVPGTGTGLGSSSAFTVALLHLLSTFKGQDLTASDLAKTACKVEIEMCGDPIGKQDQYASAFGGINRFRFNEDDSVEKIHTDLDSKKDFLNESLLLYHTGVGRFASSILAEQRTSIERDAQVFQNVRNIRNRVSDMQTCLVKEDSKSLGSLLSESWEDKKKLASGISNSIIDQLLESAVKAGALGGKLVGAGGGGFLLLCIEPGNRSKFQKSFSGLRNLPFQVENEGSKIVYDDEDQI
jgi:D-glycero-alpha-D-manno-heptose-7-phosphate kinase